MTGTAASERTARDGLVVRPVDRSDYPQWLVLWDGYNRFYERSGPTALPAEVTSATWARLFDPIEPVHGLVAESGSELVGMVHYLYHRSTTAIELSCYLQDLFTRRDLRGRGIGRALIEAVYAQARLASSPRVYWHTHETNHAAMQLYDDVAERTGFLMYRKLV